MFLFYVLSFFKKGDTRLFKGGLFKEIRYICIFRNKCNCFCKFLTFQSRPSAHQSCFFAGNIPACLEDTDRPKSSGDTKLQKYHIDKEFILKHFFDLTWVWQASSDRKYFCNFAPHLCSHRRNSSNSKTKHRKPFFSSRINQSHEIYL